MRPAVLVALLAVLALPAPGQEVLRRPGLLLHVPAGERDAAVPFLRSWPGVRARIRVLTGATLEQPVDVELVRDGEELTEAVLRHGGGDMPGWVAGVAFPARRRIVIRLDLRGARDQRVRGLLLHELAHVAVGEIRGRQGAAPVPRWFDEGLAQYAEGRPFVDDAPNLKALAFFGHLLDFGELERAFPPTEGASALAYAQSEAFVRFLVRQGAEPARVLELLGRGTPLERAVAVVSGLPLRVQEDRWRSGLRSDLTWLLATAVPLALALLIVVASFVGLLRARRRRRALERKWAAEGLREEPGEATGAG